MSILTSLRLLTLSFNHKLNFLQSYTGETLLPSCQYTQSAVCTGSQLVEYLHVFTTFVMSNSHIDVVKNITSSYSYYLISYWDFVTSYFARKFLYIASRSED